MASPGPHLPPVELVDRVGPGEGADPFVAYEREGAAVRARLERLLPEGWTFDGKRVLDFGCGSGRVLRHFLPEATRGEFWGCDIHGPSVEWIQANLSPPLNAFQNEMSPPLPLADEFFDLIWATSVFTHIDAWSDWLLEMHRLLAPGGLLMASFLGESMWEAMVGEHYREDEIGMTVRRHWTKQDAWVFHSEWWLRAHWGRGFDIVEIARPPRLPDGSQQVTHSYVVAQKHAGALTRDELERRDPDEPRELAALMTNVRLLRQEVEALAATDAPPAPPPVPALVRQLVLRSPLGPQARRLKRRLRASR